MLDSKGFDLWANDYDKSVSACMDSEEYPFAGYRGVLGLIYNDIRQAGGKRLLDVGIGTGVLAKRLYDDGCSVCGVDFSEEMLAIAHERMPGAWLIRQDFSAGLPKALSDERFEHIVCTYAIHHLRDDDKVELIEQLRGMLALGGTLYIGDVAFTTRTELEWCRAGCAGEWDDEELYPVAEELLNHFPDMNFMPVSFCAGVFTLGSRLRAID